MKFQRLTILASAVILGLGLSSGAYAFSAEMTKSYSQGDKASFLAGAHNQKGISCQMCHTTDKVSDSETEINKQCVPRAQRIGQENGKAASAQSAQESLG